MRGHCFAQDSMLGTPTDCLNRAPLVMSGGCLSIQSDDPSSTITRSFTLLAIALINKLKIKNMALINHSKTAQSIIPFINLSVMSSELKRVSPSVVLRAITITIAKNAYL